jgi:hypothetical protein
MDDKEEILRKTGVFRASYATMINRRFLSRTSGVPPSRKTSYYAVTPTRHGRTKTLNGQDPRKNSAPNSLVHRTTGASFVK